MKKVLVLGVSLLALINSAIAETLEESAKQSCEEMGYDTKASSCIEKGGTPLLCPFASAEDNLSICLSQSCRGYPLFKENGEYYYFKEEMDDSGSYSNIKVKAAPATGTVESYIDGTMESCTVSVFDNYFTYYRVPKCKADYRFDNNICIEGCDTTRYPYSYHPGTMKGTVDVCVDAKGEHYGYIACNDGWLPYPEAPTDGQCNLNSCTITEYPYMSDPNQYASGVVQNRGELKTCKIGGNTYYKYVSCTSGYTLVGSVCVGSCEINVSACTSTLDTSVTSVYKNWSCGLKNASTCRVGDNATINGKVIGTVFHLPGRGDSDRRVLIMGANQNTKKWANGATETTNVTTLADITGTSSAMGDMDGKKNTYLIKKFKDNQGYADNSYPALEACWNYTTSNCTHDMCKINEWYLGSLGELGYMYDNRYVLYNATGSTYFTSSWLWSSTERSATIAWGLLFSSGARGNYGKYGTGYVRPVLAF